MNLWSLLLPFKWIIIGVGEVIRGIIYVLKRVLFYGRSLFKNLFLSGKWLVLKIVFGFSLFFRGLKVVASWLGRLLKNILLVLFKIIKTIIVNAFKGLFVVIKYIFITLKYIITYLFKIVQFVIKYLFIGIKTTLIYLAKFLKFIIVDILYKYVGVFIIALLKYIVKIPIFVWQGMKFLGIALYKILIFPFVYLYNNFGKIIKDLFNKSKSQLKAGALFVVGIPKKLKEAIQQWFYNISFVKDIRNKREMQRQALLIDFDAADAVRSERKIAYRYVAKNLNGKVEKGHLSAYSRLDVHSYLLAEGYEVYEIEPAKGLNISFGGSAYKLKVNELVFFLTQLSTYIKSGIPLVDSIKILSKQTKKKGLTALYKSVIYDLTMGDSFSEALEKQSSAFPRLLVNMVKSAELAGNLSETLDDMADYYTSVSKTRKQMISAMTYPTVILVFAISVVVFILTFVIPSFIDMYKDADAEVPGLTMAVINLSDFLVNNVFLLIVGVILVIVGLYFMYKNVKVFRLLVQWILMHLPVIGNIIIYNEVTMFSKTFASLWNHNVFITSSMEILSKITDNEVYKMLIFDAITNVARGDPVSVAFKDHWAFPIVAYEMLVTGERTGQPGPMMDKVADFYQEEHSNAVNQVKAFIEPALIIVLAVVVGVILLSVVLPMFNMYTEITL
ncbi:MAG: type II secretion system F family protein [Bacilli bacterium]|nr:type II secretion system F family protein [Bacilli bacterium]